MINKHSTVREIIDWWFLHGNEVEKKVAEALEDAWEDNRYLEDNQCECGERY